MDYKSILDRVMQGKDLGSDDARDLMSSMIEGDLTDAQAGAILIAMQQKKVTADELSGFVEVLKGFAITIDPARSPLLDTCGTGGDCKGTFNISTAAALVTAGAGVAVAKHGNRSVSSRCGSADVLQALGVRINIEPQEVRRCIEEIGIGFLFAPAHHPAFKNIGHIRKELGVRTIFNMLGPLLNPAGATCHLMGVYDAELTELYAKVLMNIGVKESIIVNGGGLDEITTTGKTKVTKLHANKIDTYHISPEDFGLPISDISELKGGSAEENADIIRGILKGEKGPKRDIVILNSAAGLVAAGVAEDMKSAIPLAEDSIDSGKALEKLIELKRFTDDA